MTLPAGDYPMSLKSKIDPSKYEVFFKVFQIQRVLGDFSWSLDNTDLGSITLFFFQFGQIEIYLPIFRYNC